MKCPFCNFEDTNVLDSRDSDDGEAVKRRRICPSCRTKFNTMERVLKKEIMVIKKDGDKMSFDREKLFTSIYVSAGKRLTEEQMEEITRNIYNRIENSGANEVKTSLIAELVMDNLERIDKIAYIRFAAMYMKLETLDDINEFIKNLSK
jgi:transcriptional repressor NrdR